MNCLAGKIATVAMAISAGGAFGEAPVSSLPNCKDMFPKEQKRNDFQIKKLPFPIQSDTEIIKKRHRNIFLHQHQREPLYHLHQRPPEVPGQLLGSSRRCSWKERKSSASEPILKELRHLVPTALELKRAE